MNKKRIYFLEGSNDGIHWVRVVAQYKTTLIIKGNIHYFKFRRDTTLLVPNRAKLDKFL